MTRFEKWFIKRIFEREVQQGYDHDKKIMNLYRMVHRAALKEFREDNKPTLDDFLREQFEKSLTNCC